jgi:hypothetical protein
VAALRQIYYLSAVLPAVLYLAVLVYGDRVEAIGAGYAGLALIVPIYLSFAIGVLGVLLIHASRRRSQPLLGLIVATVVASAISLWFAGKVVVLVLLRPLLLDLGLI